MDRADYFRYRRLAASSDMDFLKYFILTILVRIRVIYLIDYQHIYISSIIDRSLQRIYESHILLPPKIYEYDVRGGYINYLGYIEEKKKILRFLGEQDERDYLDEREAAEKHLMAIGTGKFSIDDSKSYVRRLATKLVSAQYIAERLKGVVFDSMEYEVGFRVLQKNRLISQNSLFASHLFNDTNGRKILIDYCIRHYGDLDPRWQNRAPLSIFTPIALFADIIETDLLRNIKTELSNIRTDALEREVIEFHHLRKGRGRHLRKYKRHFESLVNLLSVKYGIISLGNATRTLGDLANADLSKKKGYSLISQLIVIALEEEDRHYNLAWQVKWLKWWISWFSNIFTPKLSDRMWEITQRKMGLWTDTSLYVPPFEGSIGLLEKHHLR